MPYRIAYANASGVASFKGRTVADAVKRAQLLKARGYMVTITDDRGMIVDLRTLELAIAGTMVSSGA